MTTRAQWPVLAGIALLLTACQTPESVKKYMAGQCAELKQTAAISQRAAQICSTELVGCSLSLEQIKQVLADQEAAKACP